MLVEITTTNNTYDILVVHVSSSFWNLIFCGISSASHHNFAIFNISLISDVASARSSSSSLTKESSSMGAPLAPGRVKNGRVSGGGMPENSWTRGGRVFTSGHRDLGSIPMCANILRSNKIPVPILKHSRTIQRRETLAKLFRTSFLTAPPPTSTGPQSASSYMYECLKLRSNSPQ